MCPSFKALKDEKHSTRGRANLLRSALTGDLPGGLADPALAEALDLCLGCKACKSECPTSVDMTKLKAEAYAQKYRTQTPPLNARVFAAIDRLSALASPLAPLANFALSFAPTRWLFQPPAGYAPGPRLPNLPAPDLHSRFRAGQRVADVQTSPIASGPLPRHLHRIQ